jgi:adenylosuccinate synthase
MAVTAVIGLLWGDEGKGKVVDALSRQADVVVRCQGGANAGHTVVIESRRFILHLVPSGILRPETACLIGNGVVVDLDVLDAEIRSLEAAGIETAGRLFLSRRAHLVLPLHKQLEAIREDVRGARKLGTTKRGIGPCYSDKSARLGLRVGDVLNPSTLRVKAEAISRAWQIGGQGGPGSDPDEILQHCQRHEDLISEIAADTSQMLAIGVDRGDEIVLEGSQGFLLDIDHGTYPFVTSSNTGIHGLVCGAGIPPSSVDRVLGVVKAYMTRVGEGPFPTCMDEPYETRIRERGCEYGATTGRPRRCGWLDLVALDYACALNGVTSIAITKLDTLSGLEMVKVCTAYDLGGQRIETFPGEVESLSECVPRYETMKGWDDIDEIAHVGDLPGAAREYVERITGVAHCGLEFVSVGPGRDELITVAR